MDRRNLDEQQDALEAEDFMYAAYAPDGPGWTADEIEAITAEQERREEHHEAHEQC